MSTAEADAAVSALKERHRTMWSVGDYPSIGDGWDAVHDEIVALADGFHEPEGVRQDYWIITGVGRAA